MLLLYDLACLLFNCTVFEFLQVLLSSSSPFLFLIKERVYSTVMKTNSHVT